MALVIPLFISHRGCPHQCLFCNQHSITGRGEAVSEVSDPASVIEEWLCRSPGHDEVQVAYYGGSFTCLPELEQQRLLAKVQPYLADGRVGSIRLSTRPDCIEDDIADRLYSCGVRTVELGVQSLSDTVLELACRGHSNEQSFRAMHILRKAGLKVGVQLLPGLPGETTSSFLRGVREVIAFGPDLVRLYPAVVVRGSGLAELYHQGGYRPLSLNKAIAMTRRAKKLFDEAAIPVVRMGLQPTESLENDIVAGPYHAAFGELVVSRNWFRELRRRLNTLTEDEHLTVFVSHRDMSAVVGMKRRNVLRLDALGFKNRYTIVSEKSRDRGSKKYVVS